VIVSGELNLNRPAINVDIIDRVNSDPSSTWLAGKNANFHDLTLRYAKGLCGAKLNGPKLPSRIMPVRKDLPDSFDARDKWGSICPSTSEIRDQAACGSCWAFGAVEAMTDRICIASNGKSTPHISAEDMLSCCDSCGFGCEGGYPGAAWDYWVSDGVVTGNNYGGGGCYPYLIPSCDHHVNGTLPPCGNIVPTPPCANQCQNGQDWNSDKHFGTNAYAISSDPTVIQTEIFNNGPVEAAFSVYEDFLAYKQGVYQHVTGDLLGGHAIKILGWGTQSGTPYWIVANSWNPDWGNKGFFNILRGSDECGIEEEVVAGLPKL